MNGASRHDRGGVKKVDRGIFKLLLNGSRAKSVGCGAGVANAIVGRLSKRTLLRLSLIVKDCLKNRGFNPTIQGIEKRSAGHVLY